MENDTLTNYVATERARMVADDAIRAELLTKGWDSAEIEVALGTHDSAEGNTTRTAVLPGVFSLIKETCGTFMRSYVFFSILSLVIAIPLFLLTYASSAAKSMSMAATKEVWILPLSIFLYIGMILLVTPSVFLSLKSGELTDVALALKKGASRIGRYFGFSLVSGLIMLLGFVLLIIPGVILSVWYTFVGIIAVLENDTLGEALAKSKAYVKGRWWGIFWRMLCGFILIYLTYIFVTFIIGMLLGILHVRGELATALVGGVAGGFYMSIMFIYHYTLYTRTKKSCT